MKCHLMDERPRFRALEILGCGGLLIAVAGRSGAGLHRILSALQAVGQV